LFSNHSSIAGFGKLLAMEICSVGKGEESKGASPNCKGLLLDRGAFSEEDLRLIRARSGIKKKKKQVCEGHNNM